MPKKKANVDTHTLTIAYENGETEQFALEALSPPIVQTLALHGLSQKLGDSYAGKADDAYELSMAVWENLVDGIWTLKGEGVPRVTILVRALLMIDEDLIEADVKAKVADMDKAQRKALELNPKVASNMAQIKAEDAMKRLKAAQDKAEKSDPIDVAALLG